MQPRQVRHHLYSFAEWRRAVGGPPHAWAFPGRGLKVASLWKNQRLLRAGGAAAGADARGPERGRPRPQHARRGYKSLAADFIAFMFMTTKHGGLRFLRFKNPFPMESRYPSGLSLAARRLPASGAFWQPRALASDIEKLVQSSRRSCGNRGNPVQTQMKSLGAWPARPSAVKTTALQIRVSSVFSPWLNFNYLWLDLPTCD